MILGDDETAVWGILDEVLEGRCASSKIQCDPHSGPPAIAVMGVYPLLASREELKARDTFKVVMINCRGCVVWCKCEISSEPSVSTKLGSERCQMEAHDAII